MPALPPGYQARHSALGKRQRRGEESNIWQAGHVEQFTYIPGYDPPRNQADFGTSGEDVTNIVMFVNDDSVDLEWRPPNHCVQGHVIQVFAIRHLPNIRRDFITADNEPLVFHTQTNQSLLTKQDAEFTINVNLTSCMHYRVEIASVYRDEYKG